MILACMSVDVKLASQLIIFRLMIMMANYQESAGPTEFQNRWLMQTALADLTGAQAHASTALELPCVSQADLTATALSLEG